MKLSIKQLFKESFVDIKKYLSTPILVILSFLSLIVNTSITISEDFFGNASMIVIAISILSMLISIIIDSYQILIMYNIQTGKEEENIFLRILSKSPRIIGYTTIVVILIFIGIALLFIAGIFIGVMVNEQPNRGIFIITTVISCLFASYFVVRMLFCTYMILIMDSYKPIRSSMKITKNYQWKLLLIFIISIILFTPILLIQIKLLPLLGVNRILSQVLTLPLSIIYMLYFKATFLNTFLFCINNSE